MAIEPILLAIMCVIVLLAICVLIFLLTMPKRMKMIWFGLTIAEKVLKMNSKYNKKGKRR